MSHGRCSGAATKYWTFINAYGAAAGTSGTQGDTLENDKVKDVHTERIFVTAEMARRWLRQNIENNRPLNRNRIAQYSKDMKNGRWKENGDTIKFADDGVMIDGQHRLSACVECGIGFWSLVAYGIKKDAFMTIDRNQTRSTGQLLHLTAGVTDYNSLAAALNWLYCFKDGIMLSSRGVNATPLELQELLAQHPGIAESVKFARGAQGRFRVRPASVLPICHYLFTRQDSLLAEAFFDSLTTGTSLRDVDPVYRLRERIINAASTTAKRIDAYELIALFFKAWLAEREQRTISQGLRWAMGESFPNIGPISEHKMRPELKVTVPLKGGKKRTVSNPIPKPEPAPVPRVNSAPTRLDTLLARSMSLDKRA